MCVCTYANLIFRLHHLCWRATAFKLSVIWFLIVAQVNLPAILQQILEFLKYSTNIMKLGLFISWENLAISKNRTFFPFCEQRSFEWHFLIPYLLLTPYYLSHCYSPLVFAFPEKNSEVLSQLLRLENLMYSLFVHFSQSLFPIIYDVYQLYIQSGSPIHSFLPITMPDVLVWTPLISF